MTGRARRNPPDLKSDTFLSFAKKEKEAEGIPSRRREEVQGRQTLTGDVTRTASVKYTRTEIGRATKAGTGTARKIMRGGEIETLIVNGTVIAIGTTEIKETVVVKADTTMTETEIGVRTMIDDETRTGIGLGIMTVALVDDV